MEATSGYRHAPLVHAIFQLSHPAAAPLSRGEQVALRETLRSDLPLAQSDVVGRLEVTGAVGSAPNVRVLEEPVYRLSSRDRRTVLTMAPTAVTLETSNYPGWAAFSKLFGRGLGARMDIAPVDGVERIGLRYIDELRVPGGERPVWSDWVDGALVAPTFHSGAGSLDVKQQQAVVQYALAGPGVGLVLRYGAQDGPSSVLETPVARPDAPPAGPFFLVDTDAFWAPVLGEEVPVVEVVQVIERAEMLHGQLKDIFEATMTQRMRDEVLNAD